MAMFYKRNKITPDSVCTIMINNNRPLSPHIQIYRWKLTMFLSILHRLTGVGLAFGAVMLALWLCAALRGEASFLAFHSFAHSLIGQLMFFGWLFAFIFHFFNGLRHLVWDTGHGIGIKSAQKSGQLVLAAAFVFTLIFWLLAR